jgi:hypothetical protein
MAERGQLKRRHLIYYLRVIDVETDHVLGHLVDVTTDGIMLMSPEAIPADRVFHLRMMLPAEAGETQQAVEFEARSARSGKDLNPDFFDTGFHLVSLTPKQLARLVTLIEDHGFRD